jgi:hypothetical protein
VPHAEIDDETTNEPPQPQEYAAPGSSVVFVTDPPSSHVFRPMPEHADVEYILEFASSIPQGAMPTFDISTVTYAGGFFELSADLDGHSTEQCTVNKFFSRSDSASRYELHCQYTKEWHKLRRLYDSNEITDTEYEIRANQNKMHRKNTIAITVTKGKINSILFADCKLFVGLGKYRIWNP